MMRNPVDRAAFIRRLTVGRIARNGDGSYPLRAKYPLVERKSSCRSMTSNAVALGTRFPSYGKSNGLADIMAFPLTLIAVRGCGARAKAVFGPFSDELSGNAAPRFLAQVVPT